MRSRYSAYVRGEVPYLIATHRPASGKKASSEEDVSRWSSEIRWSGLEILGKERGGPEDADGEVEFVARYEHGGQSGEHHERSRFSKIDGRWFYVDGTIAKNEPRRSIKIGRNDPCPCGSGKKYKKCCGT